MAFVPTLDLEQALLFDVGTLGLTLEQDSPYALGVRSGGTRLRVTRVEALTPDPFTVLGWVVDDISAAVSQLRSRGVEFAVYGRYGAGFENAVWTAPGGAQVAGFDDPDGNTLSLTEF